MFGPTAYRMGTRLIALSGEEPGAARQPGAASASMRAPLAPVRAPAAPMPVRKPPTAERPVPPAHAATAAAAASTGRDAALAVADPARPAYLEGAYRPNGLGARVVAAGTADRLPPARGWGRLEPDDRLQARPAPSLRQPLIVIAALLVVAIVLAVIAFAPFFTDGADDGSLVPPASRDQPAAVAGPAPGWARLG